MEQEQSEVQKAVLTILSHNQDGDLKKVLEAVVEWENNHPAKNEYDGFAWHDVYGDPRTLNSLVTHRILKVVFKSNKYCAYRAVDVAAVERALASYEGSFMQETQEEEMPLNLFNIVVGHEEKKDIINRSLAAEKPVHCLLWGTVASAKTLILDELTRLPQSRFILGSSLTRAGLLDILFNERPRYLIIDELEKIEHTENLAALLSLMERGVVTETKYRRHRTIRLKTWVFASANVIQGLPKELLSRFTPLRFRDYTPEEFTEVTVKVLTERESIQENLAVYIAERVQQELVTKDVRDAIKVARLLKEKTKEDADKVVEILKKQK